MNLMLYHIHITFERAGPSNFFARENGQSFSFVTNDMKHGQYDTSNFPVASHEFGTVQMSEYKVPSERE